MIKEQKEIKVLDYGFVRLVDSMGDDSAIVQAARVSYGKGTKTVSEDRGLIRYLMKNRHTSPFEMCEFKFHCKMPLFTARQWIRHRTASVNEVSGRYSELPEEFYVPKSEHLQRQSKNNKQGRGETFEENEANHIISNMTAMARDEFKHYHWMLDQDVAKEIARINLPLSTYTEWYWKIDLHNLFHFLKLRLDQHAQYEIRVYANAMYELIKQIVPISCEAFEDYMLNAQTLSAQEMTILKKVLGQITIEDFPGLSKREVSEFKQKFGLD